MFRFFSVHVALSPQTGRGTLRLARVRNALPQRQLLHPHIADLAHIEVFSLRQSMALTVPNSFGSFPARPNLPTIRAVQLASCRSRPPCRCRWADSSSSCRVLVAPGRDAERLRRPDIGELRLEVPVAVEDLNPLVAAVAYIDVALRIDSDRAGGAEIALLGALGAPGFDEHAVLVELGDAGVAVARRTRRCCRRHPRRRRSAGRKDRSALRRPERHPRAPAGRAPAAPGP